MNFGTFIDREGRFIDTVHFPQSASKYPFRGRGVYKLKGKVVEEFDFHSIEVAEMEKLNYINIEDELENMELIPSEHMQQITTQIGSN
jgi:DNA polymerase-3 subunit alpha